MIATAQQPTGATKAKNDIPSFSEAQHARGNKVYLVTFALMSMTQPVRDQHDEMLKVMAAKKTLLMLGSTSAEQQVGIFGAKSKDELSDMLKTSPAIKEGFIRFSIQALDVLLDSSGHMLPVSGNGAPVKTDNPPPRPPSSNPSGQ